MKQSWEEGVKDKINIAVGSIRGARSGCMHAHNQEKSASCSDGLCMQEEGSLASNYNDHQMITMHGLNIMNIPLMMTCNACRYARSKSSPATQMIIALVAILLLGPACVRPGLSSPTAVNPTTVKTALGNINGKLCPVDGDSQNNVARFMGIPYGKAKRWSVPTMYNTKYPNHGYNAKQPGAVCMQAPSVRSSVIMSPAAVPLTDLHAHRPRAHTHPADQSPRSQSPPVNMSEDCQFLNVWKPVHATPSSLLPVRVFFHGGAYVAGQ